MSLTTRAVAKTASASSSALARTALSTQVRYASTEDVKKPAAPSWQKGKESARKHKPLIPSRVDKRYPGAFRPMNPGALTHPLFESDARPKLALQPFEPEKLAIAQAMQFPMTENDAVRIFGLPKSILLEFRMMSTPFSVVRDVTKTMVETLSNASERSSADTRIVLTGTPGCGKSYTYSKVSNTAQHAGGSFSIFLEVPINMVNSTSLYTYDLRTQTFLQPTYAYQTLQRFLTVNQSALSTLTTQREIFLDKRPTPVPAGTPIPDLINMGTRDASIAPTVLSAVLEELGQQTQSPVLLAVDDFQAVYCKTSYRDPSFAAVKPYHLSMPRLILEYASGKKTFARGAVVGALSCQDTTFQLPLELREALGLPHDRPSGPYVKRSAELTEFAKGLRALPVPDRLSVEEAATVYETWTKDKGTWAPPRDEYFMAKYSESCGNARDLVKRGLRLSLET